MSINQSESLIEKNEIISEAKFTNNCANFKSNYKNNPDGIQFLACTKGIKEFEILENNSDNFIFEQNSLNIKTRNVNNEVQIISKNPNELDGKYNLVNCKGKIDEYNFHDSKANPYLQIKEETNQSLTYYEPIIRYVKIPKYRPKFVVINYSNVEKESENLLIEEENLYSQKNHHEISNYHRKNNDAINFNSTYTGTNFLQGQLVENDSCTLGHYIEEEERKRKGKSLHNKVLNFGIHNKSLSLMSGQKGFPQSDILLKLNQNIKNGKIVGIQKVDTPIYHTAKGKEFITNMNVKQNLNKNMNKNKNKIQFLKNIPKKEFRRSNQKIEPKYHRKGISKSIEMHYLKKN